ncbi:MAG: IS110 family transposase [Phycisphaerae bacterium]|nr:IS110 family transposase [Phycisphaerae bacterium]
MNTSITYVGMDTHKKEHTVAVHFPGEEEIVQLKVRNTVTEIGRLFKRLRKQAPGDIRVCYEAGPCGFVLKRRIEVHDGCKCSVIAPSLTPVKPGDRVKTDRRDALKLMTLFKAGLLTEIYAPDSEQEAARELTRCRDAARVDLRRIQHQLLKFLGRNGYHFWQGDHWTQKHFTWLRTLEFAHPYLRDVFDNYFTELQHCMQRLASLDKQVQVLAQEEPYKEIVGLLRCFHGVDTLTAITLITELFNLGRFATARELMSYLGLTPSEHSTGQKERKGSITKTGNKRVRRLLVQTSWNHRHPYRVSRDLEKRRQGQPQWAIDIADRAGQRLRKRYWHLVNRGKMPCKATTAIARELAGFIWALFREYDIRKRPAAL